MTPAARLRVAAIALVAVLAAACVASGEAARRGADRPLGGGAAPDADPMAAWMALASPGEAHGWMGLMEGEWDAEVEIWHEPGAEPERLRGVMTNTLILGGRYLLSEYRGEPSGGFPPMEGRGWLGHDNATGRFVGTWIDTLSTTILPVSEGDLDADRRVLTMWRRYDDPFTGAHVSSRDVTTVHGRSRHEFEMFRSDDGGEERLSLRIVYSRRN